MLNDACSFKQIYIVTGYTDLRSGIHRLAALVQSYLGDHCFEPDTLYLFCGCKTDRIKGLLWENDGYLLLYKRLEVGNFQWPKTGSYSLFILKFVLCTNISLFWFKIANELSEFRNYLLYLIRSSCYNYVIPL